MPINNTCPKCGGPMTRDRVCEDYLIWTCDTHGGDEYEYFGDMSDESWEWVKDHMRKTCKSEAFR